MYAMIGDHINNPMSDNMNNKQSRSLVTYNHITYLLYVLSYFTAGLLWIVPIFMNYAKRRDADGTWLATHFDWQIKTFWYSIVWFIVGIGIITFALGSFGVSMMADSGNIAVGSVLLASIGFIIMGVAFIWHLYRIVRGWIALADGRPVP
ncbi:membrane protein [Psychrobacter sp. G]|nr:membrane protein [Psychrobacter sp. G]